MAADCFTQDCQNHQNLSADTWPADTSVREKIYNPVGTLQCTAAYELPRDEEEERIFDRKLQNGRSLCSIGGTREAAKCINCKHFRRAAGDEEEELDLVFVQSFSAWSFCSIDRTPVAAKCINCEIVHR